MSIVVNQNLDMNIERLAAQKNLYSRAKSLIGLQMLISLPIAVGAVVVSITMPDFSKYIALWGIIAVLLDVFILQPSINKLQDKAARIQELFDTSVFGLNWNYIGVGRKPETELVVEESQKHGLGESKVEKLRTWYPESVNQISSALGTLICQRSNIWWDAKMRRKYASFIKYTLISIVILLVGFGVYGEKDLLEFLAFMIAPLMTTYIFGYRQMKAQSDAADRLDNLKELFDRLWDDALRGKSEDQIKLDCRLLQDQIFEHRRTNPPIFDFVFNFFRDGNELLMNRGAEDLVGEYLNYPR